MMCDEDLILALDSTEFGTDRPEVVKEQTEDPCCGTVLKVQMSRPLHMRRVVNLIIAVGKINKGQNVINTIFPDHELLNIFEEHVSMRDMQNCVCSSSGVLSRSRRHVDVVHSVCNPEQRKLVLCGDNVELHAIDLPSKEQRIVNFSLSTYIGFSNTDEGQLVALGIANTSLYITCVKKSGTPILLLEKVDNKDNLAEIHDQGEKKRFLFFKCTRGLSNTTFESVNFKGWYISTVQACNAPVVMCAEQTANHLTNFMVKLPQSLDQASF